MTRADIFLRMQPAASGQDRVSSMRFSTAGVPPAERLPFWREVLGRTLTRLDIEPLGEAPFQCEAVWLALPGLSVTSRIGSPYAARRTRELVAGASDDLFLVVAQRGLVATQLGREATTDDGGGAILMSNVERASVDFPVGGHVVTLRAPRDLLAPMIANVDAALLLPIRRDSEPMRLLTAYVDLLLAKATGLVTDVARLAATHVHDLIALSIGTARDWAEVASGRGLRAARLRAIQADIARNLDHGDVAVSALAARHRLSPRYIQKLFESENTTLTRFVREQRLARVHRQLSDPRYAHLGIATVAYDAGFGDLSTFNRDFRRQYGMTPSEVRASARRQG